MEGLVRYTPGTLGQELSGDGDVGGGGGSASSLDELGLQLSDM